MIDLETINSMWEKDSKIDDIMLDQSTIKIPPVAPEVPVTSRRVQTTACQEEPGTEEGAAR